MTAVKDLIGQRVFHFHPQRAWEIATVVSSFVSDSKTGPVQMLSLRYEKDGEGLEVPVTKQLPTVMYKHLTPAAESLAPDNLLTLAEIHHSILLHVLRLRHSKDVVYTFLGELVIALNPFKYTIPAYQEEQMPKYLARLHESQISSGGSGGGLPPHLWNVVHQAFVNMTGSGKNHSIIISGESGSGKTEACKIMVRYLCRASELRTASEEQRTLIHRITVKVQQSSPILEAFGNAKTMRNDNSSRFGKFMEVQFNEQGILVGMRVTPFLLEKTRVVHCGADERVFHVFYQLVAGASPELKSLLRLKSAKDFAVLGRNISLRGSGIDDAKDFQGLQEALADVGFSESERMAIWRILAAILHLQTLEFTEGSPDGRAELSANCQGLAQYIGSDLLCLKETTKFLQCLVSNSTTVKGETLVTALSVQKASDQRSSLCKHLYQKLFFWIVQKINASTAPGSASGGATSSAAGTGSFPVIDNEPAVWIALLDIFGFEDFGDSNSFEQFCINLANETLQRHYTRHNFVKDVEEMKAEGILGSGGHQVKFRDNLPCLELMQGVKNSVMSFLDDASTLNQERSAASNPNFAFLRKLTMQHLPEYQNVGKSERESLLARPEKMEKPSDYFTRGPHDEDCFTIRHYAGDVKYKVLGFVEKNNDVVKDSTLSMLQDTADEILKDIISMDESTVGLLQEQAPSSPQRGSPSAGVVGQKKTQTVGSQFRASLRSLSEMLDASVPNWVRCIRPHQRKSPGLFDGRSVLEQLVATGVLESVHQRQQNFPFRMVHSEFIARYAVLGLSSLKRLGSRTSSGEKATVILTAAGVDPKDAQVGRGRVFIRSAAQVMLEEQRAVKLKENVFMAQRWLSVRRSRELHCILLWTVHVKRMQKLARRKLRIVRAVRAYYAELRQRILDRHAFERKEVGHVEAKERSRTILEERASVMEAARIFRIALVPMVATVLRNIQSVEFEKRQALNDEARQAAWGFEQMFATGIVAAVQRKKERLERQLRELLERQQALVVSLLAARTAVEGDEAAARRRLQLEVIGPEKAAVHAQAERNRQAAKARSAELQRLAKAHAAEQFRLEQQRCRAVDEEEERWRSRVGAAQVGRDLLYACRQQGGYHSQGLSSTMAEADRQLQRFYTARGPSHIASAVTEENAARSTASGGLLDSEAVTLGKAASYEEYAAWWRAEYASAQRKGQRGSIIVAANSACLSLSELDGTAEGSLATSPSRPAAAPAPVVTMLTRPPVDVVSPMERARIAVQQPPFTRVSSSPLQGRCKKPALVPPEHRLLSSSRSHGSAADDAPPSSPRSASSRSSSSSSSSSSFDEMKEFRRIQAAARRFGPASGSQSSRHLFDSQAEHYSQATAASYDGSATASFNSPRKGSAKKAKVVKPFGTLKVSPTASIALEKYRQLRGPSQPNSPMTTPETLAFRAGPLGSVR